MSVSLKEVIQSAGFDLDEVEDAEWLISREDEFDDLVEQARDLIDYHEEHNRFDEVHRDECEECRDAYDDFCQECADEDRLDNKGE